MNYALATYEKCLQCLIKQIDQEHREHASLLLLQAGLQDNIDQTRRFGDVAQENRVKRMEMIALLNNITQQVLSKNLVEFCAKENSAISYFGGVNDLIQYIDKLFSNNKNIESDHCKRIFSNFRAAKLESFSNVGNITVKDISEDTSTNYLLIDLHSIQERVSELEQLIRIFCSLRNKSTRQAKEQRENVQHKLTLLMAKLKEIDYAFDNLISTYQAMRRLADNEPQIPQQSILYSQDSPIIYGRASRFDPKNVKSVKLREAMKTTFSLGEIKLLCDDLELSDEDIEGKTREEKILGLIGYCKRHNLYSNLVRLVLKQREHLAKDLLT